MPENLPRSRYKIPVSLRLNYFIADRFALRLFYRYYFDDFDLKAHTISAELPIKLSSALTIYPMYRFYTQTQSKYFAPFGEHPLDENFLPFNEFYTSDYDLSTFTNKKFCGGLRISPVYGLKHWAVYKNYGITFKSIDLRYAHYNRSDGLKANSYGIDFGFVF